MLRWVTSVLLLLSVATHLSHAASIDEVMGRIEARCDYTQPELTDIRNSMVAYESSGGRSSQGDWRNDVRDATRERCDYSDAELAAMYAGSPAPAPGPRGGRGRKGARWRGSLKLHHPVTSPRFHASGVLVAT